jgi:hypothetical protein
VDVFRGGGWLLTEIRGCPDRIQGLRIRGAHMCVGGLLGGGGSGHDRRRLAGGGDDVRLRRQSPE